MTDEPGPDKTNERRTAAETLLRMIDYAITEGTVMRLPTFVLLMRLSRLELMNGTGLGSSGAPTDEPPRLPDRALN